MRAPVGPGRDLCGLRVVRSDMPRRADYRGPMSARTAARPVDSDDATARFFRELNASIRPAVKVGFGSPPPVGYGLVVLATTGRVSRLIREVPLLAWRVGPLTVVSTVRSDSQWLANLEADPSALLWQWGRARHVTASIYRGVINTVVLHPD